MSVECKSDKFAAQRRPITNNSVTQTVSEAVDTRRSVRAFTSRKVPPTLLRRLLLQSARSPSGGNIQPWKVYVLGPTKRDELVRVVHERIAAKDFESEVGLTNDTAFGNVSLSSRDNCTSTKAHVHARDVHTI